MYYHNFGSSYLVAMCMSDSRQGFGLDIGIVDHFNTQLIITLNYSVIADLHTLQITVTHTLVFSVCYYTFPGTASNSGYSLTSRLKSSLNDGSLPTVNSCSSCSPYNPSARTTVSNSTSNVARRLLSLEHVCLRLLPRNGSTYYISPSLRLFVPNSLQAHRHFFFSGHCSKNFESGWRSYTSGSSAVCSLFFCLGGGQLLHNVLTLVFRILTEDSTSRFPARWFIPRSCRVPSASFDVVAPLSLGPLFHCCKPGSSIVSSRTFNLSRFLLQQCPWSDFSVVSD
jgi:hypothetical protein